MNPKYVYIIKLLIDLEFILRLPHYFRYKLFDVK